MRTYKGFASAAILALAVGAGLAGTTVAQAASGSVTQITIVPTPIAPQASLAPQDTRTVTVTAYDYLGDAIAGASLWLGFQSTANGGTASVGSTALGKTLQSFTASDHGRIQVVYTAGTATGGKDTLQVQNTQSNPTVQGSDSYIYTTITKLTWNPKPIAPASSLTPGQSVNLTLTVFGLSGSPAPNTDVLLLFKGVGHAQVGSAVLSQHPITVMTDSSGHVAVTYTAASSGQPAGTVDKTTAEDASRGASVFAIDTYHY